MFSGFRDPLSRFVNPFSGFRDPLSRFLNPFSGFANLFSGFWIENIDTELVEMGLCRIKDKGWTIRGLMG